MRRPVLSLIVVLYNMRREAPRTLYSLSARYQQGIAEEEFEVHVVENGSAAPVDEGLVRGLGPNFHYHRLENPPPSPARALNYGVAQSRGRHVGLMIDGAHILTPRVLEHAARLARALPCPIVAVRRFYLGPGQQPETIGQGYSPEVEDGLLQRIGWPREPYRLFEIAAFMGRTRPGWFGRFWETNCLILPRKAFDDLGGCDERFDMAGGGFLNLDLFSRCAAYPGAQVFVLLGEGSFHQVHGGTTTNATPEEAEARVSAYRRQYEELRGRPYQCPHVPLHFFGQLQPHCFLV